MALSTRGQQTVLLSSDGSVWGLGVNANGSLGDGTTLFRSGLVRMQSASGNLSGAGDVACGTNHTAVLMGNGTVWTVGLNSSGELGNGNTTSQRKAVQVLTASGPLTGVTALAAGASHTLALGTSGEVWAWGSNAVGQLGNNSTLNSIRAVKVPGLTGIVAIAAGDRFSYAIKNDGTAWAFGDNANGQLGNNSTTASRIPVQVRTSAGNLTSIKAVAAGSGHGVFLTATGSVWSVGLNTSGQLGNNSTINGLLAVPSRGVSGNLSGIAEVACGDAFTLFLSTNGTISAVGSNTNGQLGDGTRISRLTAVPVAGLTSVSFVCAGADRSFGVKSDGSVFAWGGDLYGALAHGERGFEWSWTPLPQWPAFARGAAGSSHTLWLKADGSVWAAGANLYGQLGNGLTSDSPVPVRTQSGTGNLTAIQDVAAGSAHSLALAQNGAVWAWGLNSSGRLGDGTGTSRTKAVLALDAVGPISGTSAVAVGDAFSLALRQGGSVWAWGLNSYSQLGDGTSTSQSKAVPVLTTSGTLAGITALAAGANHGVALKGDGTVWVWGYNNQGQLGLGNTLTQNRAVSIPGVNDALAIAAGSAQTYILRSIGGGTAWGAGQNNVGQLADGTTTARSSLVQVQSTTGTLTGLAWVRAGALAHHAAAGRMDGTSWIWGQNDAGQLATGNFTNALKALALPPDIRPQTIGARFTLARRAGYEWVASGSFLDGQWGDGRKAYYAKPTLVRGITFAQTPPDTDGDGVPDWQEIARGSSATIADTDGDGLSDASDTMPLDFFNGSTPALSITSGGNQTGLPGIRLAQPLVVTVWRNGTALANAPVVFSVSAGGLAADGNGTLLLGQLPVRTNAAGQAIAYYTLPSSEGTVAISVQAGNATASVSATAILIPAAPVLSISGGTFTTQRRVVATSATPDARIHYTLDGADPTSSSPSIASGETILVDRTATLKTRAIRTSGHVSPVVSGAFKITGQVSAGAFHMGALKVDGSVWTWGNNENGQLDSAGGAKQAIPVLQSGISTGRALSCGAFHTLVLLENGTVVSFGRNQEGQLGHSAASQASVSGLVGVRAVAAGGYHSLALKEDGTVWAWGANWFGQLGDGTTQSRSEAVQALNGQGQPLRGVVAVAAGVNASYALLENGTLWAWGGNWSGHLGDGTQENRALPVRVGTLQSVVGMAAGWNHAAAVKSDGSVWCWGDSGSGQIGGDSFYFGAVTSPVQAAGISTARAVAAGSSHTLAVLSDGSLRAWGNNFSGQLGSGVSSITSSRYVPQATLFAGGVAGVSAGGFNTVVLRDDGSLRTFGYNEYGQMGAGDFQAKPQALASQLTGGIAGVSTGIYHSAIRFADGRAGWFGFYETGNLYIGGDDPDDQRHEARVFPNFSGVVQVVSGDNHSLALKNDGTVWAWGIGGQGQLGTGSTGTSMEPQRIPELSNVVWVSAAANSSLAVKADGTVWTWGVNDYGQLGDGGWIDRFKPAIVVGLSSIKQAEIGFKHGVAVSGSGIVSIWGNNESANLSLDAERGVLPPRVVPSLVAAFVAAGDGFTVALKADGTLSSWGTNESGQLGLGDRNLRSAPTGIPNASAIVQVVAKGTFAMALKQDGTALAWGQNGLGQLGDGTFVDRPSAVSVANLDSVSELFAGAQQSFAVLRNGTLRSWGNNGNQQLGRSNANIRYPAQRLVPDAADANNNAVPDAWEIAQFGNTTTPMWEDSDGDGLNHIEEYHLGTNPKNANTDGDIFTDLADPRPLIADADPAPTATLVGGNDQRILPGTMAPQPLEILLTLGGQPMANMPVIARLTSGTGKLAATANATVLSGHALLVRTDAQGKAHVHLQAPATEGTITVTFDALPAPITFQATATSDTDANGLRDLWEIGYFGAIGQTSDADPDGDGLSNLQEFQVGSDPVDFFNGSTPALSITSGVNQTGLPGSRLAQPLVVTVWRNGTALANAPVVFSVSAGGLAADGNGTLLLGQLPVRTNAAGQAIAYYTLPSSEGTVAISVQAGNATASVSATAILIPAAPVLSISGGTFTTQRRVVATSATPDARIHYTLDGADPTSSSPSIASGETILVDRTAALKTRAIRTSGHVSPVVSGDFKITGMVCAVRGVTRILKSDGTVWGWGQNWAGHLGDGSAGSHKKTPVQARELSGIVSMAADSYHTLALDENGSVWAWGLNWHGQLGDGTTLWRTTPVKLSTIFGVKAIATGPYHSLALSQDGSVYAWGSNWYGQLGDGTTTSRHSPTQVAGLSNVVAIACGEYHSLALTKSGVVYAWGYNVGGQLGDGTLVSRPTPTLVGSLSGIQAISAGAYHTLAMSTNGTVYAWGQNTSGQLGDGTNQNRPLPVPVAGLSGVATFQAGFYSSFVIQSDGKVRAWGANWYGQLGDLTARDRWSPVSLDLPKPVTGLDSSLSHTMALFTDGTLGAWGSQESYALGDQRLEWWSTVLLQLKGLSGIASISSNSQFTAALAQDGRVLTWGENWGGQLGDGTTLRRRQLEPFAVQGLPAICEIFSSQSSVLARGADGSLWTWGSGNLGLSNATQSSVPVRLPSLPEITALPSSSSEYGSHSLVVDKDSKIWAWGGNWNGQLGDNSTLDRTTPAQVPGIDSVQAVAMGALHNLALKKDGTVWSWGYGEEGQLGDPALPQQRRVPARVNGLSNVVAISAGHAHSMALTANGSVFVWGTTEYESVPEENYPFNLKSVPTQRAELPPIVSISSSGHTLYAMAADGTVWTWGAYSEPVPDGYWQQNPHREVPVRRDRIGKALANSGSLFLKQDGMLYTTEAFPADCRQIRLIPPPIRLVPDAADANNNAVPDAWELVQFGNTTTPLWEDSDGDGLNHIEEYHLGTNPKNANTDGDIFTDLADPRPLIADADAAPTATLVGGNDQRILPGTMAPQTMEILLTLGDQPMPNMPVIARLTGGTGKLAATANATVFSDHALLVRTDAQGKARVHLQAPATEGTVAVSFDTLPSPITFQATAEIPTVTLAVAPASVTEDGAANLVYTFTRTGSTANPLNIHYTVGGTASLNDDYTGVFAWFQNPENNQFYKLLNAGSWQNSDRAASLENGHLVSINSQTEQDWLAQKFGEEQFWIGLTDEDDEGRWKWSNGDPVLYTNWAGDEPNDYWDGGEDYAIMNWGGGGAWNDVGFDSPEWTYITTAIVESNQPTITITIPAGASTAAVTVDPTPDSAVEPDESVSLSLLSAADYKIGTPAPVTGIIQNDDTIVILSVSPASMNEDGATYFVYSITRTGVTATSLTVNFTVSGSATLGTDYTADGPSSFNSSTGSVVFPPTGTIGTFRIIPIADPAFEPDETVNLTLAPSTSYAIGTPTGVKATLLNDDPMPPVITSALSVNATVGVPFTYQIAASNNATSYTASLLPAGLTLNSTSGLISGTPTAEGNSTVSLGATNAGGTGNATLTLQVLPPAPVITSALSANATVGTAFTYQITASNNATSYSAGGLPVGMTLNATSGLISGTPTAEGAFTIGLMASNSGGSGSVSNLTLTVAHTRIIGVSGNLSFGMAGLNQPATRTLTIANTGTGLLTVTGISYPTGFSGNLSGNLTVAPNTSQNVTVTFTPTAPGSYDGTLTILSDATSGTARAEALGVGSEDTDNNGMRDSWEIEHFGAIGQNPNADPDSDGWSNIQEFQSATNPTKADSDGDGVADGTLRLNFQYDLVGRLDAGGSESFGYDGSGNVEATTGTANP